MRVKCTICDKRETIDDWSFAAKRLRNKPVRVYLCDECNERIEQRTIAREATGNFNLYPTWASTKKRW
ncbi:MAG: YlaI family protein [Exiguobacterium oxidotolerans]|uniref:YlaI family protein n=1 Tax=Exiguobacterium oxidotolerans TaxID=223958 RepID=UPI000493BCE3|nr:YlaI family protein [Exiguobacterium oxidotolerans]